MNLAPLPVAKFFDNDGKPLAGGKLFTYAASTTTKLATYTDAGGLTPNTNPIILDFRGECRVWIDPTLSYKFTLAPSTDTDPPTNAIWTVDSITAGPASMDNAALDTGSGNNVLLSIPNLPSTPIIFTRVVWKAAATNSGAMTIAINGGAVKNLLNQSLGTLAAGDVRQNGVYQAVYDGTQWQLQSLSQAISPTMTAAWSWNLDIAGGIGGNFRFGTVNTSVGLGNVLAQFRSVNTQNVSLSARHNLTTQFPFAIHNEDTSGNNSLVVFLTDSSSIRGSITYNRGGGLVAYNTTCRERLKKNIKASAAALPLIMQIPIVEFDWKDTDAHLPFFVTYEKLEGITPWACQNDGVNVSALLPLAIKAIQELSARIAELEARPAIKAS